MLWFWFEMKGKIRKRFKSFQRIFSQILSYSEGMNKVQKKEEKETKVEVSFKKF